MRIRNIKPEFWRSDDIKRLPREYRLLFIGLWSYVDDNGVGIDDYRQVAADLFALEDDQTEVREYVQAGLQRLAGDALVSRYVLLGKSYLFINSWVLHQKVHNPNKARYPLPNGVVEHPASGYVGSTETLGRPSGESTETLGSGGNGHGSESTETDANPSTGSPQVLGDNASTSGYVDPPETLGTGSEGQGVRGTEGLKEKDLATAAATAALFDEFWDNYPRKDGKANALKAWPKACKRLEPQRIVAAARYWAGLWENAGFTKQFIPHPTTWLNGERWNDEPPLSRAQPAERRSTTDERVAQAQALKALYAQQPTILQLPGAAS